MQRMIAIAASLAAVLVGSNAWATDHHDKSLTMRTVESYFTNHGMTTVNDDNHLSHPFRYRYDQPMLVYEPNCNRNAVGICLPPQHLLIVFLHGHSSSPSDGNVILSFAATLGFHGISLDYDYGNDALDPTGNDNAPRAMCGCYTECYGQFHDMILSGNQFPGVPLPEYSVKTRLKNVLRYLVQTRPDSGWDEYIDGATNNIEWPSVVLVAHSRGSSLATHLAKFNQVNRLVTLSGDHDQLVNGTAEETYGDSLGKPTTLAYGEAQNPPLADCAYLPTANLSSSAIEAMLAPSYIQDNSWNSPGSTTWGTQRDECNPANGAKPSGCIYAFSNEADTFAPYANTVELEITTCAPPVHYDAPIICTETEGSTFQYGTQVDLQTIRLDRVAGGHLFVGDYTTPYTPGTQPAWEAKSPHWLTPGTTIGQVCQQPDAHDSTIGCSGMSGSSGSGPTDAAATLSLGSDTGSALEVEIWRYMLLNGAPSQIPIGI